MKISTYKVNIKHRGILSKNSSIWNVDEWFEIKLLLKAKDYSWQSGDSVLWSTEYPVVLGKGVEGDLYLAKFVKDKNDEWHGYPICPQQNDIPPSGVLKSWLEHGLFAKKDINKIVKGQFK